MIKINKKYTANNLKKKVEQLRRQGKKIVLSSGSWDMLHVGHMRYLNVAKQKGDFLIVGVDSDEKIKKRKGPERPIVHEDERMEMLSHLVSVDAIFLKKHTDKSGHLIKLVSPDILIVSESTKHSPEHLEDIKKYCKEVCILLPQAQTSTTAKIRKLHLDGKRDLTKKILSEMPNFIQKFLE
jgi:D-beta-D-heptose 7-phosphate kinase/D-beta-D-heptose 1-phosphate adenosyltransferase